ncbi:MAG TPA: hypothetical protein VMG82_33720 [Candidatus Sulfotelmatobacter sp.]|nr:hypothetical protein [Candidatus Sulfotelmatobacter sp.]
MSTLTANVALVSDTPVVDASQVSVAAAALNKQVTRDFGPLWNVDATISGFDKLEDVPVDYWPVIIRDDINQPGAAGFHTDDNGQPFALIQADDSWTLTSSHEVLEMLADPFGNRTVAGSPPPDSPDPVASFDRVLYLVEVCDPCESDQFAYTSNGVTVSDFITPHYYDPNDSSGAQYSFGGNIEAPHTVLEGGYVSFGNPIDNHWYQIFVVNGEMQVRDLEIIQSATGRSLREQVDLAVRKARQNERYRIKPAASKAMAAVRSPIAKVTTARAKSLRNYVQKLKSRDVA